MVKRILIAGVAVLLIGYIGFFSYQRYRSNQRLNSGEVDSHEPRGDGKVMTENGEDALPHPSRSDTPSQKPQSAASPPATTSAGMTPPATDSIAPNPPNGMAFAGSGRFQVYRQGNLTWRVDTENGSSCILFATNEEWRKPVVYNHGCGSN